MEVARKLKAFWPLRVGLNFPCFGVALLAVFLLGFLAESAYGQAGTTGAISGIVTDSQGAVVPGADVQARQVATGVVATPRPTKPGSIRSPICSWEPMKCASWLRE